MVKKFLKIILMIELIFIICSSSTLAVTGKVTGNSVRIREKASSESLEISVATKGETVEILGDEGNWYHIKFENITGYISKDYVETDYNSTNSQTATPSTSSGSNNAETTETPSEVSQTDTDSNQTPNETSISSSNAVYTKNQIITLKNDINLRYLPSFTSRDAGTASSGSTYTIKDTLNNWVKITSDLNNGWVLKTAIDGDYTGSTSQQNDVANIAETTTGENSSSTTDSTNTNSGSATPDNSTSNNKGKVNVDSARIRKSPDGDVLDSLSRGTEVTILGEEGDWYKISTDKYETCYVAKRLITEL